MMKFGTGLSAVFAGVLLWAMMVLAADKAPTKDMAPTIGRPDTGGLSPEAALAVKNFSAGFIRFPAPYDAQVSQITGDNQTTGNKRLLGGSNQIFYLELSNPQEAAPGDKFTIYRRVKKVYHPIRGHYLGDLTAVLGVVQVLRVTGNKATVKIERSFDAIFPGDGAMRQTPSAPAPAASAQSLPDSTGVIVELPPGQTLIAQGHAVYIDWGRNDGVKIGDRLEVFRENTGIPIQIIGELQVVAVEDQTATGRVTRSNAPFLLGDRFAAKETLQKQLGSDAPMSPHDRKEALFQDMNPSSPAAMLPGGDIPDVGKSK